MYDVLIVGAGPAGLSAAYAAKTAGLSYVVIERGCLVHTVYQFPAGLTLYSTPELIELADVPLIVRDPKPSREDALRYYRRFVEVKGLTVHTYEEVTDIRGQDGAFELHTTDAKGSHVYQTRKVILATGAFDQPNRLTVRGEDLPKVHHSFKEAHPYYGRETLVIGGKSSAVETALSLYRAGAKVTLSYRRNTFTGIKYWVLPDLENRIKDGSIRAIMNSTVTEIRPTEVVLEVTGRNSPLILPNDFVFCMIGHEPDVSFLNRIGVGVSGADRRPVHNPDTFESSVPGIYVIGVLTAGNISSEIFIENGRSHGPTVIGHILRK